MVFSEIRGQKKAVKLLGRALDNECMAHAYLFTGPDGVGKVMTARAMAAAVFCRKKKRGRTMRNLSRMPEVYLRQPP